MKQNKKCVLLALMLFAVLSFCMTVSAYAMPHLRDGIVTDRDGIIEGDSEVTLPKVTVPSQNGTMTPSEQESGEGGLVVSPNTTGNAATSDAIPSTEAPATERTTAQTTTKSPSTTQRPISTSPVTSMQNNTDSSGIATWGIVLAIIIVAAIAVIVYMIFAKKR